MGEKEREEAIRRLRFPGVWKNRKGKDLPVARMHSSHIRNALRMLHRCAFDVFLKKHGLFAETPDPTDLLTRSAWASRAAPLLDEWEHRGFARGAWNDEVDVTQ